MASAGSVSTSGILWPTSSAPSSGTSQSSVPFWAQPDEHGLLGMGEVKEQYEQEVNKRKQRKFRKYSQCPEGMVGLGRYCMDAYEVHLVRMTDGSVFPHFHRPTQQIAGLKAVSVAGTFPQGYMTRFDAEKTCENAGKRLCTLSEWRRACAGPEGNPYSYGKEKDASACNVNKTPHVFFKVFGGAPAGFERPSWHFNDPRLLQVEGYLEKTGTRPGCKTSEGIYDLNGNLAEWNDDIALKRDETGMWMIAGTFAGQSFSDQSQAGCRWWSQKHIWDYKAYFIGARCCVSLAASKGDNMGASSSPKDGG
ncbi:MAG: SUMF1/EgtB/PvdO family nonheme iron enzyme [Candidatus Micrarchaeota archaeon]